MTQARSCPHCGAPMAHLPRAELFACPACNLCGSTAGLDTIAAERAELVRLRETFGAKLGDALAQHAADLRELALAAEGLSAKADAAFDVPTEQWNRGRAVAYRDAAKRAELITSNQGSTGKAAE